MTAAARSTTASIIIPAHNEELAIGRLLTGLLADAATGEFEVFVVCNGCTDRTAEIARAHAPKASVIEIPERSKQAALRSGDAAAHAFPRVYLDADLELTASDVRELLSVLDHSGLLATAPQRQIRLDGVPWVVRSYYRVWERLPQVTSGLFGRGVIALTRQGVERILALPPAMSDDLAISEAFEPHERMVASRARVVIRPPKRFLDLMRRRVRVATGTAQFAHSTGLSKDSTTSLSFLLTLIRQRPSAAVDVLVFASVAVLARAGARHRLRKGDFRTWDRDESSRAG
jgi:glycosyltransferase involved in cell wall biosynthesis